MRKLPDGTYMYDEDPAGSNEFGDLFLKGLLYISYIVGMCIFAFTVYQFVTTHSVQDTIAVLMKYRVMIALYLILFVLSATVKRARKAKQA